MTLVVEEDVITNLGFLTQPIKAGVIVVPYVIRAAVAGIKLVGVPQPKPLHRFSPDFQGMFTSRGSRADFFGGGYPVVTGYPPPKKKKNQL